jgi:hypothetical protein
MTLRSCLAFFHYSYLQQTIFALSWNIYNYLIIVSRFFQTFPAKVAGKFEKIRPSGTSAPDYSSSVVYVYMMNMRQPLH